MAAVIIPVRDTPEWGEAVRSVLASTRSPDEVVVVDDGSHPPLSVDESSLAGGRVRLLRIASEGPAAARNAGVDATTSDIVVFVDADVLIPSDALARLEAKLRAAPRDVAALQALYSRRVPFSDFATRFQSLLQHHNFSTVPDREHFCGLSSYCIAVRREAFEAVGGFDTNVNRATVEDDTFGVELIRAGWRVVLVPEVEVTHLARYDVLSLCRRMRRMATDKVRSIRRRPWAARMPVGQSHHRPAFLASVGLTGLALVSAPWAPVVSAGCVCLAVVLQTPLLVDAVREYGWMFGAQSAAMMIALSGAAAVGSVSGLWG